MVDISEHVNTRNLTCGQWSTEVQAEEDLVRFLRQTQAFIIYRQVIGEPLWKHHFQQFHKVRADFLLLPTQKLCDYDWQGGAIIIETKRSGEKIGPGLNQMIDYLNTAFYLGGGVAVVPSFAFLFPSPKQVEAVASIMAHQHLGSAFFRRHMLHLYAGECHVLSLSATGEICLGKSITGQRLGAR